MTAIILCRLFLTAIIILTVFILYKIIITIKENEDVEIKINEQ